MKSWLPGKESSSLGWTDLVVIPLVAILCVPTLMWFGHYWTVIGNDSARYLLAGSQLISGQALEGLNNISEYNGGHGPGLPALIGLLILLFGRNTEHLAWAARLIALLNPLLAYFLVKRISSPAAGLIAAALVTLFGFNVETTLAVNIDAPLLIFYLLAILTLLAAIDRNSSPLAFLSGALLAISILTKENAFVNLPLALLAVLLLDWDLRGALWHYLGLVLVSLPWWIWAYSATGDVYLMDRLPARLQIPVLIAVAIFVVLAVIAYATGMVDRFLTNQRRRRWTGWSVALAWVILLSGVLLATATYALSRLSFEHLRQYLAHLLAPAIVVVPTLLLIVGYVAWKAVRQNGPWMLFALALLFQTPVCLLVTVEYWALRQFLVPQTLVLCALGALVVEAGVAALRGRDLSAILVGSIIAAPLVILLLMASVARVQALIPRNPAGELLSQHGATPQETETIDWLAQNVPEGKRLLILSEPGIDEAQANYLMFKDGGRHEWTKVRLDQSICIPRPNVQISCDPDKNSISRTPPDALWVQTIGECNVISLSMTNLLEQMRRNDSNYVVISGSYVFPGILQLPLPLIKSGAFKAVDTAPDSSAGSSAHQRVVLLESTGRKPKTLPTQMNANTLLHLKRCKQAKGPSYSKKMEPAFPNGVVEVPAGGSRKR